MAVPVGTAPLGRRDNFLYRNLGKEEIRVVIVKKHSHWPRANSLSCSIKHLNIDPSGSTRYPYIALSYTWGDGLDVTSLIMRDELTGKSGKITIMSSLFVALQTILGSMKESRLTFWIDQICINQSSTVEKGQQVQLKRWIYEKASLVYIWLGPASSNSNEAMLYLESSDETSLARDLTDPNRSRITLNVQAGLEDLFDRAYWTRTWTVQEATALEDRETLVFCGDESL